MRCCGLALNVRILNVRFSFETILVRGSLPGAGDIRYSAGSRGV